MKAGVLFMYRVLIITVALTIGQPSLAVEEEGHEEHEGEEETLSLTATERNIAGIETTVIKRQMLSELLRLPGEVIPNAYQSTKVTPRIPSFALARHALLGEVVVKGQPLVRLSSVEMARAQGDLVIAANEWERVRKIGRATISDRRYTEAQVAFQQAQAKVQTFGMTQAQAQEFVNMNDVSQATGAYELLSPQNGTVISDDFLVGERIEPGQVIFELTDESSLWIEARTSADKVAGVQIGALARITPDKVQWREAKVVQIHHSIDESTRTQAIRVELPNEDDWLHPGQFVEVEIATGSSIDVLAIPTNSVVLLKGATTVFRLEDGDEFHPEPVILGATVGNWREVVSGIKEGDVIATAGTFFLKSLVLKSELGEGHAH